MLTFANTVVHWSVGPKGKNIDSSYSPTATLTATAIW